jgi:hypothetical protein
LIVRAHFGAGHEHLVEEIARFVIGAENRHGGFWYWRFCLAGLLPAVSLPRGGGVNGAAR